MQRWGKQDVHILRSRKVKYSRQTNVGVFCFLFLFLCSACVTSLLFVVTAPSLLRNCLPSVLCGSAAVDQLCSTTSILLESSNPVSGTQGSPSLWSNNQYWTGQKPQIKPIRVFFEVVYRHWKASVWEPGSFELYGKCPHLPWEKRRSIHRGRQS